MFSSEFKAKIAKYYPSSISKDLLKDNIRIEDFDAHIYSGYDIRDISYDAKSKMLYATYKGKKIALLNEINLAKDENLVGIELNIKNESIINPEKYQSKCIQTLIV
ncbi:hypothetical protein ACNQ1M_01665 [Mycoplasma sp. VS424B]|uniref:hypothetical protein n=1 Tax=unclassified Mycoplasma TaxID=2683645 RepID=UPI003AAFE84F